MQLTEQQAKDKWCPMVRVGVMPSSGGPSSINDPTVDFHGNCIASGCMMWRWSQGPYVERLHQLDTHDVERLTGEKQPRMPNGAALHPDIAEKHWREVEAYMRKNASHPSVVEAFEKSAGEGWKVGTISYDEEDGRIYCTITRANDPSASGHCGLAGRV